MEDNPENPKKGPNLHKQLPQIHRPETISSADLWQRTKQGHIEIEIKRRRGGRIGHTL